MNLTQFLFEDSRSLNKELIVGTKERITYRQSYTRIAQVAAFLREKYQKQARIGIIAENGIFFISAYLGIIKAGYVAVLLSPRLSPLDFREIVDRCGMRAVFVQDRFQAKADQSGIDLITESELEGIRPFCPDPDLFSGGGEELAVIIFTSGSTDKVKGVMLSHKNIIANTESIISYLRLSDRDRIEVVLPFHYCYGTSLLHTHLRVGGSMVINRSIFLGSVIKEINEYHCTGFAGVPTTFSILLRNTDFKEHSYPSLRYVTQAGGKMADCLISEIRESLPETEIYIMYGQTEATARLAYLPPADLAGKLGSIGKGIPGVELKIIDDQGESVAPGEVGEIVARGDNVMLGYYNDPEGTEEALNGGYLHTGDLATIDEEGFIYVVSREKEMIKSAGYRISPKEIKDLILTHPEVVDCAVLGMEDELLGEAIVVFFMTSNREKDITGELKQLCNRELPSYKIPKYCRLLDRIPLNSSMKVDKLKLKELAFQKESNQ